FIVVMRSINMLSIVLRSPAQRANLPPAKIETTERIMSNTALATISVNAVNAFEHLMFADDRAETPMTFFLRMTLTGDDGAALDHERLREAVARAITRHPLLQSTIAGSPNLAGSRLSWQLSPTPVMPF